jgi:hypothetical protein
MGQETKDAGYRNIVNLSLVKTSEPSVVIPKAKRFAYVETPSGGYKR